MIVPSIDLFNGKAVQWRRGAEPVLEREDVFDLLEQFRIYGDVAVIDLNAATNQGDNRDLIGDLLKRAPCRVGGGIRDRDTAMRYLKAGASKIILGTSITEDFVRDLPREAVIAAIDSRGDRVVTEGWRKETTTTTESAIETLADRCSEFLFTHVDREGMMGGLDRTRVKRIVGLSPLPVTVAGGITTSDDVRFLHRLGAKGQIGMALYTGRLDPIDAFAACVDFRKAELIPTIVQDEPSDQVLMLAYSTRETLDLALRERRGIYYSRSRSEIWRKGDTSGHVQVLRRVDLDCDGDTLLFRVDQTGHACHLNRSSCFPSSQAPFDLRALDRVLAERARTLPTGSYSARLFQNAELRFAKLREEVEELIEAEAPDEIRWEAADVIFFALAHARACGVGLHEIQAELRSRHGNH